MCQMKSYGKSYVQGINTMKLKTVGMHGCRQYCITGIVIVFHDYLCTCIVCYLLKAVLTILLNI